MIKHQVPPGQTNFASWNTEPDYEDVSLGQTPYYNITNYPSPIGPNTQQGNFYSEYDDQDFSEDYPSGSFPEKFDRPEMVDPNAPPPGTFQGVDADGNEYSINPNMKEAYDKGWRPGDEDKCPKGHKWDPERLQCYKETKGTFEPEANMLIAGIRGLGNFIGKKGEREQEMRFKNMTLADSFMPSKPRNNFKTQGLYDVNTFGIPNAGVYATNYVQPREFLPSAKKGGDIMYLNDKEILDIINMGGQVEFLD